MNFFDFRKKIEELPFFSTKELRILFPQEFNRSFLNNLKNWTSKGYLIKIKKGFYLPSDLAAGLDPSLIASKTYFPSYVSLESALGHYGIIPEAVFTTTSITTKKTFSFTNKSFGNFSYQKIKKEAFGGFITHRRNNISFNFALPEKALVDWLYINRNRLDGEKEQFLSYRFNEDFNYNQKKLKKFAKLFSNKKTTMLTNNFIKIYATGKKLF